MKTSKRRGSPHAPAFTLIELMVVIAIIMVLASMTVAGVRWYRLKAAEGKTKILISSIERGLEEYRLDNGFFPEGNGESGSSKQVYIALYGDGVLESDGSSVVIKSGPDGDSDSENKVYLDILNPDLKGNKSNVDPSNYTITDAWGMELYYRRPGEMNPADDFDLWSLGANGVGYPDSSDKKDKSDDLKNW